MYITCFLWLVLICSRLTYNSKNLHFIVGICCKHSARWLTPTVYVPRTFRCWFRLDLSLIPIPFVIEDWPPLRPLDTTKPLANRKKIRLFLLAQIICWKWTQEEMEEPVWRLTLYYKDLIAGGIGSVYDEHRERDLKQMKNIHNSYFISFFHFSSC